MLEEIDLHDNPSSGQDLPPSEEEEQIRSSDGHSSLRGGARYLMRYVQARLRPSKFSSEQDLAINNGFRRMDSLINELEDYELTERVVIQELSRHYIAVIIGCWIVMTLIQGISLLWLYFWEFGPIVIGMIVSAVCILYYYSYIWEVLRLPFSRLWRYPYPYAMIATALGCLSQHTVYKVYRGFNLAHLLISFFLIEAFYIILVSSAYQEFMIKAQKMMTHRKLCYNAVMREQSRVLKEIENGKELEGRKGVEVSELI